jgi:hypothetical protein
MENERTCTPPLRKRESFATCDPGVTFSWTDVRLYCKLGLKRKYLGFNEKKKFTKFRRAIKISSKKEDIYIFVIVFAGKMQQRNYNYLCYTYEIV